MAIATTLQEQTLIGADHEDPLFLIRLPKNQRKLPFHPNVFYMKLHFRVPGYFIIAGAGGITDSEIR
jgi:hypothetical protein